MTLAIRRLPRPMMRVMPMMPRLLLLLLATTACSAFQTASDAPASTAAEVKRLQSELLAARQQAAMDSVELRRLRRRMADLEAAAAAKIEAVGGLETEALAPLRPVEDIESLDLDDPDDVEQVEEVEEAPELERQAQPSDRVAVSSAAQALYDRGYTLYHQGRYLEAEQELERFLVSFHATDLGDNAQYWVGESRLARGDFQAALSAFEETLRRYPDGNKAPDALFKAGRVLEQMGDLEGARRAYEEVRRLFPGSDAEVSAAAKLDEL